jgi:hypothetical protein
MLEALAGETLRAASASWTGVTRQDGDSSSLIRVPRGQLRIGPMNYQGIHLPTVK